jgi:hypothetical protein
MLPTFATFEGCSCPSSSLLATSFVLSTEAICWLGAHTWDDWQIQIYTYSMLYNLYIFKRTISSINASSLKCYHSSCMKWLRLLLLLSLATPNKIILVCIGLAIDSATSESNIPTGWLLTWTLPQAQPLRPLPCHLVHPCNPFLGLGHGLSEAWF